MPYFDTALLFVYSLPSSFSSLASLILVKSCMELFFSYIRLDMCTGLTSFGFEISREVSKNVSWQLTINRTGMSQ